MQDPGKGGAPNRRVERVLKRVPVVRRCTVGLGRSPPGGGGGTRFPEKGGSVCLKAGRRGDAHTHGDSRRTEGGRSILTADRRTKGSRKQRVHARSMQIEWKVTGGWTSERAARGACKRMCCTSMPGADWLRSQRSPGAGDSFRDGSAQRTQTAGGSVGRSVGRSMVARGRGYGWCAFDEQQKKKERKLREFCACRRCRGTDGPGKWRLSVVMVVVERYSTVAVGGRRGWWDSDSSCEVVGTYLTRWTTGTHGGGGGGTRTRRTNRTTVWKARRDSIRERPGRRWRIRR